MKNNKIVSAMLLVLLFSSFILSEEVKIEKEVMSVNNLPTYTPSHPFWIIIEMYDNREKNVPPKRFSVIVSGKSSIIFDLYSNGTKKESDSTIGKRVFCRLDLSLIKPAENSEYIPLFFHLQISETIDAITDSDKSNVPISIKRNKDSITIADNKDRNGGFKF